VAITPPVNANVLEGITRRSIIQLLRDELRIEVAERNIDRTEIYLADEIFMCGTGVQVASITKVEHRPIGNEEPGPITEQVRDLFHKIVRGHIGNYRHWLTPVYTSETMVSR
jgi:branched-chain amino acid aminotransferase